MQHIQFPIFLIQIYLLKYSLKLDELQNYIKCIEIQFDFFQNLLTILTNNHKDHLYIILAKEHLYIIMQMMQYLCLSLNKLKYIWPKTK